MISGIQYVSSITLVLVPLVPYCIVRKEQNHVHKWFMANHYKVIRFHHSYFDPLSTCKLSDLIPSHFGLKTIPPEAITLVVINNVYNNVDNVYSNNTFSYIPFLP